MAMHGTPISPPPSSYGGLISRIQSPLQITRLIIIVTTVLCTLAQIVIGIDVFLCLTLDLVGIGMMFYSLGRRVLSETSISAMMLIGYGFSWFYLPLIATTIEGKSLINNLARPDLVFQHNLILNAALILAHIIYSKARYFRGITNMLSNRFLRPLGIFTPPSINQLWMIGSIGLTCSWFSLQDTLSVNQDISFSAKFLSGFQIYMYAPYLILVYPLLGGKEVKQRKNLIYLGLFSLLVFINGLAHNSRSTIIFGFVNLILSFLLGLWLNKIKFPKLTLKELLFFVIIVGITISLLGNISKAMVIARETRDKVSTKELIFSTLEIVSDPIALTVYDKMAPELVESGGWDERYIDNLFLSRLCNLKFADNTLKMVYTFTQPEKAQLFENEAQKVCCFLPKPLLELLPFSIDKDFVNSGGGGDVIYNIYGAADAIGGMRTGSLIAMVFGIFGWMYPFWMIITSIIIYILADSYVIKKSFLSVKSDGSTNQFIFSTVILLSIANIFLLYTSSGSGSDSYSSIIGFIIRTYLQSIILYVIIYWGTKLFTQKMTTFNHD
jgi:hypothetical protein